MGRLLLGMLIGIIPLLRLPAQDAQRSLCWQGRQEQRCRNFLLYEVGYHWRIAGTDPRPDQPELVWRRPYPMPMLAQHASAEVGAMHSVSGNGAIGVALFAAGGQGGSALGVRGRYRRWLGRRHSVDVAAGPYRAYDVGERMLGGAVDVHLNWNDMAALGTRITATHDPEEGWGTAVFAGVELGSTPALVATASAVIAYGAWVLIYMSAGDF